MTVQEHSGSRAPRTSVKPAEAYDFRRPSSLVREHSRVLELAFETFARQWGTQLTAKVRKLFQVSCDQVQMHTYNEYASSLPATTAMVLCSIEGEGARAVIQFPTAAALAWVGHMVGSTTSFAAPSRKFTAIEQALIRSLMDEALDDLRYSLGSLLLAPIAVDAIQYNSQFAQAAATGDLMIVASFTITVGERVVPATVALPAEVLLPQLGGAGRPIVARDARDLMRSQVVGTPVDVSVQLAPAMVLPGVILGLAVGDVLALPHPSHRPLDVVVSGLPLATAAVGSNGSRLACVVVTTEENP